MSIVRSRFRLRYNRGIVQEFCCILCLPFHPHFFASPIRIHFRDEVMSTVKAIVVVPIQSRSAIAMEVDGGQLQKRCDVLDGHDFFRVPANIHHLLGCPSPVFDITAANSLEIGTNTTQICFDWIAAFWRNENLNRVIGCQMDLTDPPLEFVVPFQRPNDRIVYSVSHPYFTDELSEGIE